MFLDSAKQWAAVRTHFALMRDPPHRCPVPETEGSWMLTSQGQAPASALLPPTTRVRPRSSSEVKGRTPQFPLQVESRFHPAPRLAAAPAEAPHKVWGQHATERVPVHKELRLPRGVQGAVAWPRRRSGPSPGSPQVLPKPSPILGPLTRRCSTCPAQACTRPAAREGTAAAWLPVALASYRSKASVCQHSRSARSTCGAHSTCGALSPGLMSQSSRSVFQALLHLALEQHGAIEWWGRTLTISQFQSRAGTPHTSCCSKHHPTGP